MAKPSISIREYIRWLPDDASEPTSTLVLTTPEKRYVDIRILLPSEGTQQLGDEDVLPQSRLDWGFAGTSTTRLLNLDTKNNGASPTSHSIWYHWVDSHTTSPENATDEGYMYAQPNGKTLEKGRMVNPATGKATDYEEVWLDVEPAPPNSVRGENGKGKFHIAVLQLHDDAHEERGMIALIGQFCQGVLRVGESMTVERWSASEQNGWQRKYRIGNSFLPCSAVFESAASGRLSLGGEIKYQEHVWKVIELSEHQVE